jgi:hypothetical protein
MHTSVAPVRLVSLHCRTRKMDSNSSSSSGKWRACRFFSPDRDLGSSPGTIVWTRLAQRILHAAARAEYAMKEECVAVIFRHGAEKLGSNCVGEDARRGFSDFRVPECEEFCFSADAHTARTSKSRTRGEAGIEPTQCFVLSYSIWTTADRFADIREALIQAVKARGRR